MIRVLHCLSQIPGKTGSGVYLQALVREGRKLGLDQWVICGVPASMSKVEIEELADHHIFPVVFDAPELPFPVAGMSDVMPYPSSRFSAFDRDALTRYERAFAARLKEVVAAVHPEIIHSHHLWLMTALIRRLFPDIPLVATSHGTDLRQLQLADHLALRAIAGCQDVDKVMALNQEQKQKIIDFYGLEEHRVVVAGTGFRHDLFNASQCNKGDELTVIYAGKLSRAKGLPWLLEAVAGIENITLKLAGGGEGREAEEIRRQAEKLAPKVELLGALSQEELAEECKKSHIFVLPSFYEGLPLVLLEALACGCRVVITNLPGIQSLFPRQAMDDGIISLVPLPRLIGPDVPRDEDLPRFVNNLRVAINKQIDNVRQQQSYCCPPLEERLRENTWERIFARVMEIYREVLGQV